MGTYKGKGKIFVTDMLGNRAEAPFLITIRLF